jgi:hypothetical protein
MKLLEGILPQPPGRDYSSGYMQQLIRRLQQALGINVHTKNDADETEAINFFLSN